MWQTYFRILILIRYYAIFTITSFMNGEIRDTSKQTSAFYALQYDFAVILQTISHLIQKKKPFLYFSHIL